MRTKILVAALAASTAFAAPAFAQESAPFTGPRAEAIVGYDHVDPARSDVDGADGFTYGGAIGYDFQAGGAVVGFEGEATGATTRDTQHGVFDAGDRYRVSAGRDLYVGGRIGFVAGGNTLVYAKAGYTNARIDESYTTGTGGTTATFNNHTDVDGWRLGAGAEMQVNDRAYVKAEYRYSRYDDADDSGIDLKRHQVLAGVGVRF